MHKRVKPKHATYEGSEAAVGGIVPPQMCAFVRKKPPSDCRTSVITLAVAAFFVLLVTVVGIMGRAAYNVASRTKQLGTRRAIGATKSRILRYFLIENWITTTGWGWPRGHRRELPVPDASAAAHLPRQRGAADVVGRAPRRAGAGAARSLDPPATATRLCTAQGLLWPARSDARRERTRQV